jgi:hypothetical protein
METGRKFGQRDLLREPFPRTGDRHVIVIKSAAGRRRVRPHINEALEAVDLPLVIAKPLSSRGRRRLDFQFLEDQTTFS